MAWDPSALDQGTLSNSNFTYVNSGTSGSSLARTVDAFSSGKKAFQVTFNASILEGDYNTRLGLADPTTATTDIGFQTKTLAWASNGQVPFAAVNNFVINWVHGDLLTMAFDFTAMRLWVRVNTGNWNNDASADPVTGTNGIDISTLAGTSWRAAIGAEFISGAGGTLSYASLPSGFTSFEAAGGTAPTAGWQRNEGDITNSAKSVRLATASQPPAFGRAIAAPSSTIAGIAWSSRSAEPSPALRLRPSDPPPLVFLPPLVTWSFDAGDTIFLRDAPVDMPPAFGRAIVQIVGVSGMAWFAPADRDRLVFKFSVEAAPAIALTPATLPVPIRGMAWFEPPDRDKAPTRITFDYPAAFGRSLTAPVNTISGMAWFEAPDAIRFSRPVVDTAPSAIPAPVVTVTWSFVVPDVFSARRVPIDVPPATTFAPAALPSIGMAWFEQQDRVQAPVKLRFDAPPAFGRSVNTSVAISGMAWFAPPDRDPPSFKARIEQPASVALTPATLPVRVSGMAWFVSLNRDLPPVKVFDNTAMAMGFLGISFSPSSLVITRHLSTYGVDLDITMLPDGTPQPYSPSTDGTPWPPA